MRRDDESKRFRAVVWALVLVLCFALVGCGDDDDEDNAADFDDAAVQVLDSADFCDFETYDFAEFQAIPGDTEIPIDKVAESQIFLQNAISSELDSFGLERDGSRPDLAVNIFYQYNEELFVFDTCEAVVIAPGQIVYSCDWVTVEEWDVGTAIIDLVDRSSDTLVLRGVISGAATGNNTEVRINDLVAQVFNAYENEIQDCSGSE